ncbi:MAG TPA: GTPase HflX [Acidobacteriaceae bacterium]|nr:GTPase HflX [Acidobacteriaceae bacterium]
MSQSPQSEAGRGSRERGALEEQALLQTRRRASGERAVLVAVEFSGLRPQLAPAARQARAAAALLGETPEGMISPADRMAGVRGDIDFDASLAEFQELARSAGAETAALLIQRRQKPDPATLVGGGKVEEIEATVRSTSADLVLFDHDLSPSQLRNLEDRLPCRVIDRTQLILDIFARHARTREGQLQVELAQLEYQLPRLGGRGKTMSQLGGGIGTRGPGETQLETDRRKLRLRIDRIQQQLEGVRRIRRQQRGRREAVPVPTVALVGYTNAGKSTLFNALTGADVLESKRMFATLDPKLRQLTLPSRRRVLLADTVGFVRNLPHALVTSFRATLEEVERAELLIHVRDAASPTLVEQKAQVEAVLAELEVQGTPTLQVLNKADLLPEGSTAAPGEWLVSARTGEGIEALLAAMDSALTADPLMEAEFRIPQSEGRVLAALERGATLSGSRFEGNLLYVHAVGPASLLGRYRRFLRRSGPPEAEMRMEQA